MRREATGNPKADQALGAAGTRRKSCRQQVRGAVRVAAADNRVEPGGARDPRLRGEPAGTQRLDKVGITQPRRG